MKEYADLLAFLAEQDNLNYRQVSHEFVIDNFF